MITFEEICRRNGLDPKTTREIIKEQYTVTVTPQHSSDASKAEALSKLLEWMTNNWMDGKESGV